jgi:hypothetical protein
MPTVKVRRESFIHGASRSLKDLLNDDWELVFYILMYRSERFVGKRPIHTA